MWLQKGGEKTFELTSSLCSNPPCAPKPGQMWIVEAQKDVLQFCRKLFKVVKGSRAQNIRSVQRWPIFKT